ncbi:uncharacterized protein LOC142348280 [Convolutriloba macropyga]|uniref:uncharacterized protein LOC142348280 n=1 Tax=Convolutriloba macropyga TaxID=536237 RepID=UPI003F5264F5
MTRKDAKVQVIGSVSDGATQEDQNNQSYVSSALLDSMLPRGDDGSGGNVSRQTNRRRSTKARTKRMSALAPLILIILAMLAVVILLVLAAGPLHAKCTAYYEVAGKCNPIKEKLNSTLIEFSKLCTDDTLEKCKYMPFKAENDEVKFYALDQERGLKHCLEFSFTNENKVCSVKTFSKGNCLTFI